MLVVTRTTGQRVFIGDRIVVIVTQIDKNSVRLGIEAPAETRILREEIFLKVLRGILRLF